MLINYSIDNIPCYIKVIDFGSYTPGNYYGPIEECYPEEWEPAKYSILDSGHYKAQWLMNKITDEIEDDIQETIDEFKSTL